MQEPGAKRPHSLAFTAACSQNSAGATRAELSAQFLAHLDDLWRCRECARNVAEACTPLWPLFIAPEVVSCAAGLLQAAAPACAAPVMREPARGMAGYQQVLEAEAVLARGTLPAVLPRTAGLCADFAYAAAAAGLLGQLPQLWPQSKAEADGLIMRALGGVTTMQAFCAAFRLFSWTASTATESMLVARALARCATTEAELLAGLALSSRQRATLAHVLTELFAVPLQFAPSRRLAEHCADFAARMRQKQALAVFIVRNSARLPLSEFELRLAAAGLSPDRDGGRVLADRVASVAASEKLAAAGWPTAWEAACAASIAAGDLAGARKAARELPAETYGRVASIALGWVLLTDHAAYAAAFAAALALVGAAGIAAVPDGVQRAARLVRGLAVAGEPAGEPADSAGALATARGIDALYAQPAWAAQASALFAAVVAELDDVVAQTSPSLAAVLRGFLSRRATVPALRPRAARHAGYCCDRRLWPDASWPDASVAEFWKGVVEASRDSAAPAEMLEALPPGPSAGLARADLLAHAVAVAAPAAAIKLAAVYAAAGRADAAGLVPVYHAGVLARNRELAAAAIEHAGGRGCLAQVRKAWRAWRAWPARRAGDSGYSASAVAALWEAAPDLPASVRRQLAASAVGAREVEIFAHWEAEAES